MADGTFDDDIVHAWLACIADNAWCSLHYESPALMGLGRGEINGAGYVRRWIDFSTPNSRTMWSLADLKFTGLNAVRATHFGVWNHKTSGLIRAYGRLPEEAIITKGGGYVLHAGKLALSIE